MRENHECLSSLLANSVNWRIRVLSHTKTTHSGFGQIKVNSWTVKLHHYPADLVWYILHFCCDVWQHDLETMIRSRFMFFFLNKVYVVRTFNIPINLRNVVSECFLDVQNIPFFKSKINKNTFSWCNLQSKGKQWW